MQRLHDVDVNDVYHDVDSGGEVSRTGFDAVLDAIRAGKANHIIATKWDRVTRNLELYIELKKVVNEHSGVILEFLDGGEADLKSAAGRLYSSMQVIFAEHEREKIIERVKDGFEGKRRRNSAWGHQPWGYIAVNEKYKQDRKIYRYRVPESMAATFPDAEDDPSGPGFKIVCISKIDVARDAFDYFLKCRKITDLMKYMADKYQLNKGQKTPFREVEEFPLSRRGLKQWLTNPVFQGHTAYKKTYDNGTAKPYEKFDIRLNTHPEERLISEEEAKDIQSILSDASKAFGNPHSRFYLSGLVFCEKCGGRCNLKSGGGYSYYGCRYASSICESGRSTSLMNIEKAIISAIVKMAREFSDRDMQHLDSAEILEIRKQIIETQRISGFEYNPVLKKAVLDLREREKALLESKSHEHALIASMLKIPESKKMNFWYSLDEDERGIFYKRLINRVSVLNGEVKSVVMKIEEATRLIEDK